MLQKIKIWLGALFLFITVPTNAQLQADNWMFGYDHYVNFNLGTTPDTFRYPTTLSGFQIGKGSSSYSDENGNLLFYAGSWGIIYDRNFQPFPSTDIFTGVPLYGEGNNVSHISQPILAVPVPNNDSLFIVFHIRVQFGNTFLNTLYYSVINMRLRNGLGEVVPGQKNIPLLGGADIGYKLTAILHCNKKDTWVIGHLSESDKYFSLLLTENGLSPTPVYFAGNFIPKRRIAGPYIYDAVNNTGCLKASALGNRLAGAFMGLGLVELFDFNTQTGMGTNLKILNADPPVADTLQDPFFLSGIGPFGVDFSPSGDRLYTTSNYWMKVHTGNPMTGFIHQFDVSLPLQSQIQQSKYRVDSISEHMGGAIQIGNNGKMYVNVIDHLYEISNPEGLGVTCGYNGLQVYSGQQYPNFNLPTFLQSYFRYPVIATGNCQFQNISFHIPNLVGINSIQWDFGDPASGINNISTSFNPTHIFSTQGAFTVKAVLQNSNGCGADTIRKIVYTGPFQVNLGNDTVICQGDTLQLRMNLPNASNLWSTGSRDTIVSITQPGKYWVRTNIGECSASDTITVTVRPLPLFSLGDDAIICSSESIILAPNSPPPGVSYNWSTGSTAATINTTADGLYWLRLEETVYGCTYTDSITIQFKTLPEYSLGPDIAICEKDTLTLSAFVAGATNYLWNSGETTSSIKVIQTGIYWADVTKDGCTYRDSILVLVKPLPIVNLGNDVTLCEDQVLQLDAQNSGAQYLWQNNSSGQIFSVNKAGIYFVTVTKEGCISKDTIDIKYEFKPQFTLGKDTVICNGQTIMLQPTIQGGTAISFLWHNGSTDKTFAVTQPGLYSLELTNNCGSKMDAINIANGVCKLYVPSAFTPNNDGKNDLFKASFGENVTSFLMEIYNRSGERIFNSSNMNNGWNGTLRGIFQPNGAYIWIIKYKVINDSKEYLLKGTVVLLR